MKLRMLMSKYEIELRGPLKLAQKEKLEKILAKDGKLIRQYNRTQWCFKNSLNKHDLSVKNKDLRIKNTNGNWEISLKIGELAKISRKEISLPFLACNKKQAFNLLRFLGHNQGIVAIRNAKIYLYKDIEWAIVEVPNHSYYFEAEKLVNNKKVSTQVEMEIRGICNKLGLKIFSKKEYYKYIEVLDTQANKLFKI